MSRDIEGANLSKRRRSRWGRTKLITAAVVATLCLIWFVPWAYVRMTTQPARAYDDYADLFAHFYSSDDDDATVEWLTALAAIPTGPIFMNEPPPAGMKWKFESGSVPSVDISEVNGGRWEPASRPRLRVSMRYISSAKMKSALTRIGGLVDRPWRFDVSMGATTDAPPTVSFSEMRQLARVLVARSRYRHETGDVVGAWEDIKVVLSLCRGERREVVTHRLVLAAMEALALTELRLLLRRVTIDESLAGDIDEMLRSLPVLEQTWREAMTGELQFGLHDIDSCFSDDGHGSGWLVLSSQPEWTQVWAGGWPATTPARSRLWNLLSPLYHDRQTTTERLRRFYTRCAEAAGMPYSEGVARLQVMEARRIYEPSDGALLHMLGMSGAIVDRAYMHAVRQVATRRAARIMAALSRFRGEQEVYPVQLDDLVPQFVRELPVDPFCGGSFGYRRIDDDYLLYSCGMDGDDDGGRVGQASGGAPRAFAEEGDDIYTFPRRDVYTREPVAVPVDSGSSGASDGAWP